MKLKYLLLICPSLCFAAPSPQMSTDLGVTQEQLTQCMQSGMPAQKGGEPNKAAVMQCLQKANPNMTADQIETTMNKYNPIGEGKANTMTNMPAGNMPANNMPSGSMPSDSMHSAPTTPSVGAGQ